MDKKAIIVISICVLLIGANLYYGSKNRPAQPPSPPAQAQSTTATATTSPNLPAAQLADQHLSPAAGNVVAEQDLPPEQTVTLENDYFQAIATTHGGGIKRIVLKQHKLNDQQPVMLNNGAQVPVFNIAGWTGQASMIGYQIVSSDQHSVTFQRELQPGITITRKFTIAGDYSINLEQIITNHGAETAVLPPYRLALGSTTPLHPDNASTEERYVTLSWCTDNNKYGSGGLTNFNDSKIPLLGIKLWSGKKVLTSPQDATIRWAAVKSQFFAMIIACDGFTAASVEGVRDYFPDLRTIPGTALPVGIDGDLLINGITVAPNTSTAQKFSLYAGPKEDSRLQALPYHQDKVMEFGITGIISRFLLWLMNFIHEYVKNYGIAIICVTIFLRAILWWPQSAANRSMKRMQAVAPLMKEMQDKYKDKPDKLNGEMMKIYKEYGVNPVGGCLPMLIQFPIFIAFFWMLQSSIELRHEHFLWIKDLSQPDTIWRIPLGGTYSFPLNPMPLVMTLTMIISMHITPQPSGVDNPMMRMMKFMPLFFLIFCYNYSAALSLYWTAQNILSIVQMRYNLKQVAPSLEAMKADAVARKKKQRKR